jgi:hypothetical protein
VPDRATVCGLPVALSDTLMLALRAPIAIGVKVTMIVQLEPSASEVPQLFVCVKSVLLPVIETELMFKGAVPLFVRVVVMIGLEVIMITLPKASEAGEKTALGAAATPFPLKVTV